MKDELKYSKNPWFKELKRILKISGKKGSTELERHLKFLKEQDLIYSINQSTLWPRLTKTGFGVAVKIEEQRETHLYRLSSLALSGILAVTLLTALIHQMNLIPPDWLLLLYATVIVVMGVSFFKQTPKTKKYGR